MEAADISFCVGTENCLHKAMILLFKIPGGGLDWNWKYGFQFVLSGNTYKYLSFKKAFRNMLSYKLRRPKYYYAL